jgi:arginyl-tRNA synthetase
MILPVHTRLREHIAQVLSQLYSLEPAALPSIVLESPPNRELGDLGTPLAFELAGSCVSV